MTQPSERGVPYYDLSDIRSLLANPATRMITETSYREAASLGYTGDDELVAVVNQLTSADFHKAMESTKISGLWQDVYRPTYRGIMLYIKLQISMNGKGVVIQFKRK